MTDPDKAIIAAQIIELCKHVKLMADMIAETRQAINKQSEVLDALVIELHHANRKLTVLRGSNDVYVPVDAADDERVLQ